MEVNVASQKGWWWTQSLANPSLREFPLAGKNTGNFLEVQIAWGRVSTEQRELALHTEARINEAANCGESPWRLTAL